MLKVGDERIVRIATLLLPRGPQHQRVVNKAFSLLGEYGNRRLELSWALYNFAARMVGGLRIEVAHDTHDSEVAHNVVAASAEKPAPLRKVA